MGRVTEYRVTNRARCEVLTYLVPSSGVWSGEDDTYFASFSGFRSIIVTVDRSGGREDPTREESYVGAAVLDRLSCAGVQEKG